MEMFVVKLDETTLIAAANRLRIAVEDVDVSFGVLAVDPERHLFAVRARSDRVPRPLPEGVQGPFADTNIAPCQTPAE